MEENATKVSLVYSKEEDNSMSSVIIVKDVKGKKWIVLCNEEPLHTFNEAPKISPPYTLWPIGYSYSPHRIVRADLIYHVCDSLDVDTYYRTIKGPDDTCESHATGTS